MDLTSERRGHQVEVTGVIRLLNGLLSTAIFPSSRTPAERRRTYGAVDRRRGWQRAPGGQPDSVGWISPLLWSFQEL